MAIVILVYILLCCAVFVWFQIGIQPDKLLVLSISGLRHDHLAMVPAAEVPFFTHLTRYGARAEWLNPTPPSALATQASVFTGRYPEHHGVLGDHFLDEEEGEFQMDGVPGQSAASPAWWGTVPLWNTAVRQWRRAAVANVPGGCTTIDGFETSFCVPPKQAGKFEDSVTLVLDKLLTEPYFTLGVVHTDSLRRAAEEHGAASKEALSELRALDARLQRLDRILLDRGARNKVNILVISDGGLTDTRKMEPVSVDAFLPEGIPVTVAGDGAACLVYMAESDARGAAELAKNVTGARPYLRGALPPLWRLEHPQRAPDLLLVAEPGFYLENTRVLSVEAAGGYDDTAGGTPDMRGALMGRGPGFRAGVTVPQVNAVDVYPMMAHLIDVTPQVHSGQLDNLSDMVNW